LTGGIFPRPGRRARRRGRFLIFGNSLVTWACCILIKCRRIFLQPAWPWKARVFFFEKKNKKLLSFGVYAGESPRQRIKVFCFFFFKKEVLSFFC
jgi:hypothetical protein